MGSDFWRIVYIVTLWIFVTPYSVYEQNIHTSHEKITIIVYL
jgi:hypothetical protein